MWLMMSLEGPLIAAVIARLPDPQVNLAAFQLTFSLALVIESPVIMLLTAGTALPSTAGRYRRLLIFTGLLGGILTVVHIAVVLSPVYPWLVSTVIGAPAALVAPSRAAFLLMTPWTLAIAFRRMWQGVMIRFDATRRVGLTTTLRIGATAAVCGWGLAAGKLAGASLGAVALSVGVTVAAVTAYVFAKPVMRRAYCDPSAAGSPDDLPWARLFEFYAPLALTSFIVLGAGPVVSFGLGHAPDAMTALAVWPVVLGLAFLVRSGGIALQEVVIALLDRAGTHRPLARFTGVLAVILSVVMMAFVFTPLGGWWLATVSGLSPHLVAAALLPLACLLPVPGLTTVMSWFRGELVHAGNTPAVTRAVALNLGAVLLVLVVGLTVREGAAQGAVLAAVATSVALTAEVGALGWSVRSERRAAAHPAPPAPGPEALLERV